MWSTSLGLELRPCAPKNITSAGCSFAAGTSALCGTSTLVRNTDRYGDGTPQSSSPAGRELFKLAAAKNGLQPRDLPPSLSFFQGVEVREDGALDFTGSTGPGGSVTLRAEQDLTVLIANVPHPVDPRQGLQRRQREGAPAVPLEPRVPLPHHTHTQPRQPCQTLPPPLGRA